MIRKGDQTFATQSNGLSVPTRPLIGFAENDMQPVLADMPLARLLGRYQNRNRPTVTERFAMMFADLIDQDDLVGHLRALGFEMPSGATAEQACEQAVRGLTDDRARALRHLIEEMFKGGATILPTVRQAIDQKLLPALVQYKQAQ